MASPSSCDDRQYHFRNDNDDDDDNCRVTAAVPNKCTIQWKLNSTLFHILFAGWLVIFWCLFLDSDDGCYHHHHHQYKRTTTVSKLYLSWIDSMNRSDRQKGRNDTTATTNNNNSNNYYLQLLVGGAWIPSITTIVSLPVRMSRSIYIYVDSVRSILSMYIY